MKHPSKRRSVIVFAALLSCAPLVFAQPTAAKAVDANTLKGNWVRPDGGYRIAIKGVGPKGELEAIYYNPTALPFSRAQTSMEGTSLRVFLELRAGGYDGSTYELVYDPASDRLVGTYYQAVAKQKFSVYFARK
jgi:uncharacterized protein (DUF2147 family)